MGWSISGILGFFLIVLLKKPAYSWSDFYLHSKIENIKYLALSVIGVKDSCVGFRKEKKKEN